MPVFDPNVPIETADAVIQVEIDKERPLPVGRHLFRLVVIDDSGNESEPDEVEVFIMDTERPTAILNAPTRVPFGTSFDLSGKESTDLGGGQIVRYIWTRVE